MSKVSLTSLMVLCAAMAACSDTNPTATATDAGPAFNEASAELVGGSTTIDGPADLFFGTEASSMQMAASAPQTAPGGRASGHVGFNFSVPTIGLSSEQYSFVALSTDPTTLAAKGSFEMMLTSATGVLQRFHGDVICMNTVGNTTRIAGQITKIWINNIQRPITGATHTIWTVVDNGEGQGADTASPMIFFIAPGAAYHCATGFTPPQFPVAEGNVQINQ